MIFATHGISTIILAPAAGLVAALISVLVGWITIRVRGPSFIISSLALVMIARILFDNWHYVGGANGVSLPVNEFDVRWAKLPYCILGGRGQSPARSSAPSSSSPSTRRSSRRWARPSSTSSAPGS
jgi:ABC-type branched-subunit amino acid transport system permease subunit